MKDLPDSVFPTFLNKPALLLIHLFGNAANP
jgi:hypothetical protein